MKLQLIISALFLVILIESLHASNINDKLFHCGSISDEAISALYLDKDQFSFQAMAIGKYFSLYNDSTSPYTIESINQQVDRLKQVGDRLSVSFSNKDCIFEANNEQLEWRCYKRSPGTLGEGLEYDSISFYLYTKDVKSPYSTRKEYIVGLAVDTDLPGEMLIQTIYYQESSQRVCRFNPKILSDSLQR